MSQLQADAPAIDAAETRRRERLEQLMLQTARSAARASWAAVFTSLFAVLISVYSAYLQRAQTSASFWPNLSLSFNDVPTPRLQLINTGVGPALLQWVELRHAGKRMHSWREVLQATGAAADEFNFSISTIGNLRTLQAGETIDIFVPLADNTGSPEPAQVRQLRTLNRIRGNDQLSFALCYCSIFGECTMLPNSGHAHSVSQCPEAAPDDFTD